MGEQEQREKKAMPRRSSAALYLQTRRFGLLISAVEGQAGGHVDLVEAEAHVLDGVPSVSVWVCLAYSRSPHCRVGQVAVEVQDDEGWPLYRIASPHLLHVHVCAVEEEGLYDLATYKDTGETQFKGENR